MVKEVEERYKYICIFSKLPSCCPIVESPKYRNWHAQEMKISGSFKLAEIVVKFNDIPL